MYLSKIEIIGFKSFAQRTNVTFDTGVTAIVGPNGCGKTNIVDAIRWALGEQKYSTLRSDKMEDVIFNGTKSRKPLGLAEVSLSIENTKGILPTEYSEVTITRRVFRSGESDYLLNKVPCRLKDILDLFMDTGMGSDAYSVIELKMVETILSDKTDERRRLFEEAAGVTKYKVRRKAAMRKLESVQQDLARVNDIVKEVQKTVNSLERQAKKAEQYNDVSGRLRSLEIDLLEREYANLHERLSPLEEKFSVAQRDRSAIDTELRAQEDHVDQLRAGLSGIETQFKDAQRAVSTESDAMRRIDEKILVANERSSSLHKIIDRAEQEKTDLAGQQELLGRETATLGGRRLELARLLGETESAFTVMKAGYKELGSRVETKKSEVETSREEMLALAHEIVRRRGEQERLKARMDNLKGRVDRAQDDIALYQGDIAKNQELITQLTSEDRQLRKQFVEAERLLFEREKALQDLKDTIDRQYQKSRELRNEIERAGAGMDFLRKMIESNEGFSDGAKYLLGHETWKQKNLTTVADIIHVDQTFQVAVEAALGEAVNYLVVDHPEDGFAAFEELRQQDKGKASIVCLDWVPSIQRHRRPKLPAGATWALEVVRTEKRYRRLVEFLLDDVVLIDQPSVADAVFGKTTGVSCVAANGQLTGSSGFLRGGGDRLDEGGSIGKTAQLAALESEVGKLRSALGENDALVARSKKELESFEFQSFKKAVKSIEKEMTAVEMRIAQLEFEKKRANDGITRNSQEIATIDKEIDELRQRHDDESVLLQEQEERKQGAEARSTAATREFELLENQWNEMTKQVNDAEIKVVTLAGDLRNLDRDIERGNARVEDIRVTIERRNAEITHAGEELVRLSEEIRSWKNDLETVRTSYQRLEEQKQAVEQLYNEKRNELHSVELKIKDERRLHDDSVATTHDLEMKISELRSNTEHIKLRAKEEFDLDLALKAYAEDEFVDFAQLREEIRSLKDRIRILGAINFAAFDEFTTESERLTFLTGQRDDLLEAERTLMSTIEEINQTAQRIFSETFAKIRENFVTIFKELFLEGDECDLRLEEGVDPLEAKIEIIAKPRGKRPTSIDLLSGGEKTLTAIALLFAIYLVKPSPFCILDEVDAPLDDSNIDRYTRILKKFSDNTQFIVVTHNKRTMEAANALYGVTMEEEGISKIVTVRFNEEARVRSAVVSN